MKNYSKISNKSCFAVCLVVSILYGISITYASDVEFGYKGKRGPEFWGTLCPEWFLCSEGKAQSPIDFNFEDVVFDNAPELDFDYNPTHLNIINNGHTVEVIYDPGSEIEVEGVKYELEQFHFHAPSEHTFGGGAHFPMEMHLVHKSADGGFAVVAVFIQQGGGNRALHNVWKHMPAIENEEFNFDVRVNAAEILPKDRRCLAYEGSFTTPPCTEGVLWFLMSSPIELSRNKLISSRASLM